MVSDEDPAKKIQDCRLNADDFHVVKVIGRGAFGEVQLVWCLSYHIFLGIRSSSLTLDETLPLDFSLTAE